MTFLAWSRQKRFWIFVPKSWSLLYFLCIWIFAPIIYNILFTYLKFCPKIIKNLFVWIFTLKFQAFIFHNLNIRAKHIHEFISHQNKGSVSLYFEFSCKTSKWALNFRAKYPAYEFQSDVVLKVWARADFEPKIRLFVYYFEAGTEQGRRRSSQEVSLIEVVVWTGLRWSFH